MHSPLLPLPRTDTTTDKQREKTERIKMARWQNNVAALMVAVYAVAFLAIMFRTSIRFPLTDFATDDNNWLSSWFYTTLVDYYGVAISLCVIIFNVEKPFRAALWSFGVLFLGCWVACGWIFYRLKFKAGFGMVSHRDVRKLEPAAQPIVVQGSN
ncbi:unnamed protein product [Heterosigma akashiwo]